MSISVHIYGIDFQKMLSPVLTGDKETFVGIVARLSQMVSLTKPKPEPPQNLANEIRNKVRKIKKIHLNDFRYLIDMGGFDTPFFYRVPTKSGFDGSSFATLITYYLNRVFDLIELDKFETLTKESVCNAADKNNYYQKINGVTIIENSENPKYTLGSFEEDLIIFTPKTIKLLIRNLKILNKIYEIMHDARYEGGGLIIPKRIYDVYFKNKFKYNYETINILLANSLSGHSTHQFSADLLHSLKQVKPSDLAVLSIG